jgi:subtilase family serine protease
MNFSKISKRLLLAATVAALGGSLHAQSVTQGNAVMPDTGDGSMRSHAWVATASDPSAVIRGPGQSCGVAAGNICYYVPSDLTTAYAIGSIAHGNGGAGMTVAIVDAFYNSQSEADLATYSSALGLPACSTASGCLTIVNSSGVNCTTTPASCTTNSTFNGKGWALETDLDLEAVHAIAPNAHILLVTAANTGIDLYNSVAYAQVHADVVTDSWGSNEFAGEAGLETFFSGSPVPILFSSGDTGAVPEYPCMSAFTVCVGGTRLLETATSFRSLESAWGTDSNGGGGGGCSTQIGAPAFETGFSTCGVMRGAPDVAAIADEYTGFLTFLGTFAAGGVSSSCTPALCPAGGYVVGGTSLASPVTAGVIANIDADRVFNGKSKLGSNLPSLLYKSASTSYHYRFYDVTTGSTGFAAGPGWDKATGLGVVMGPSLAVYLVSLP